MKKLPIHGRYEWHGEVPITDDPDDGEYPVIEEVTTEVLHLLDRVQELRDANDSLAEELADIKNRRYWEEIQLVTDPRTGMTAAIKTIYQWEAKTLRLEMTPGMLAGRW